MRLSEPLRSALTRLAMSFYPCYRRTGARIERLSYADQEIRIRLPLNWRTRGYHGTLFGGSMYGAIDPVYMTMLSKQLGPKYVAWDKAATIEFRRPGRATLYATFRLPPGEVERIRSELETSEKVERVYAVDLTDRAGVVHASFTKTIHVRKRRPRVPA